MKIVTGTISHESSTFTPVKTTRESFWERMGEIRGNQVAQLLRGTNTPTGGFIAAADEHGFELIPTVYATAHPSAPASSSRGKL